MRDTGLHGEGPGLPVEVGPLVTSNAFAAGRRTRLEVSSSNFPRFDRNLNTGENNFDEKTRPSRIIASTTRLVIRRL